jgi:hypothetical protein
VAYLITGPAFAGKTTLARSLVRVLRTESPRKTFYVELSAIRRMHYPPEYDDLEDDIVYSAFANIVRICLRKRSNVVGVAPLERRWASHFDWRSPGGHVVQVQVRCGIETVVARQRLDDERIKRTRVHVGEVRLRDIHQAYEYTRVSSADTVVCFDSASDSRSGLIRSLVRRSIDNGLA